MVEHALQEAALAAEAALAGEAARAAHMEGVTAAQEEEGMAWIANAMAAAEHEFAHARPRLPVRIDTGHGVFTVHPKLAPTEAGRGHNEHMGGFNNCCIMRVFRISAERREIVSVLRLPSRANN